MILNRSKLKSSIKLIEIKETVVIISDERGFPQPLKNINKVFKGTQLMLKKAT